MAKAIKKPKKSTFSITFSYETKEKLSRISKYINRSQSGSLEELVRRFELPQISK